MLPMVIRLLGALAPKTDEGTIIGAKATAVAATEDPFKNSRRVMLLARHSPASRLAGKSGGLLFRGLTLVITFACLSMRQWISGNQATRMRDISRSDHQDKVPCLASHRLIS
jgi:hypothetical protein